MSGNNPKPMVQSTAGAIPVRNQRGQITMEKVKVSRYVTGKRPQYAPYSSDEEEDDDEDLRDGEIRPFPKMRRDGSPEFREEEEEEEEEERIIPEAEVYDSRLRRLMESAKRERDDEEEEHEKFEAAPPSLKRSRGTFEAEVKEETDEEEEGERGGVISDDDNDDDEEEIQRRREAIRARALMKAEAKESAEFGAELPDDERGDSGDGEEYEEEYTDEEDDEEEIGAPRLKPVFIRKENRTTLGERHEPSEEELELEEKRVREERRRETLRAIEEERKREAEEERERIHRELDDLDTGGENDEEEYEAWKVRELKRQKQEREQRESLLREREEVDRRRNLTEEERAQEDKLNPKLVVNKAVKGKYKYLQKYYHRGAFYLDREDDVFKRDFSAPTLEDHFDKTALPKAMQVKNFGRSGRTKYTHLADQDTTQFDGPWSAASTSNVKFLSTRAGGVRQSLEPSRGRKN